MIGLQLTEKANNLGLDTQLVLETSGKVVNVTLSISRDVRNLADLVEHVATSAGKDHDDGDGGPDVSVLDNGNDVWPELETNAADTEQRDCGGDDQEVVDRALDGRLRSVGHVTGDPAVDLLRNLRS